MSTCTELNIAIICNGLAADIHCKDMKKLKLVLANYLDRLAEFGVYTTASGNDVWYHIALKTRETDTHIFKKAI